MSSKTVQETVFLPPKCFGPDLLNHIRSELLKTYLNKCNQETGLVSEISDDLKIISNKVSTTNPGSFFTVSFTTKAIKPTEGEEYVGKVTSVIMQGIFIGVSKHMNVHISSEKLAQAGYKYDRDSKSFENDSESIKVGSEIRIIVDSIQYAKQSYNCLGRLAGISANPVKTQLKKKLAKRK